MKASDLDDGDVLRVVGELCAERGSWAHTSDVAARFPDVPRKVVAAKLRRLLQRDKVTGCACGCRGDWELV